MQKALDKQKFSDKKIGEILIEMEYIKEEDLVINLAIQWQVPYLNLDNYEITEDILNLIPKALAVKYCCLPLDKIGNTISFVISDPTNLYDLKQQESFLNCTMSFFVTTPSSLGAALIKHYGK